MRDHDFCDDEIANVCSSIKIHLLFRRDWNLH